ncbi:MAG TPA: polyphenol oxidase family protein [Vicinamibacterales bacterium]
MTLPAIPESFEWTESSCGLALRCRPLERVAPHLFTTRAASLSSQDDWRRVARALGVEHVVSPIQVHGREVAAIKRGSRPMVERPTCDVLVSNDPDTAVAVRAADCVPVLLADARSGAVAAVHAGWRGMAAGAIAAAVDALAREFGVIPAHLHAAIGPSIAVCCYEVGSEVVDAFAAAGHARHLIDRWFHAPPPRRGTLPRGSGGLDRPRLRLDLAGASRDQLVLAGVREDQIHTCGLCTAMHLDVLTSYRAEKDKAGRIAGVIRPPRE